MSLELRVLPVCLVAVLCCAEADRRLAASELAPARAGSGGGSGAANWQAPDRPEEEEKESRDVISQPLGELLSGKRPLDSFRIRVQWRETSTEVYGTGVGIWNKRSQFRLARRETRSLLESLQKVGFGAMPSQYGEESEPLKLAGEVSVTIDEASHTVVQLAEGDQSRDLDALASQILALARRRAEKGVSAHSLTEALQKLSARQLEPETLELVVLRRKDGPASSQAGESWLLHLTGRSVRVREYRPEGGYGAPRRWTIPAGEFRKLVAVFRDSELTKIPQNLDAADYTDLRVQVLDQVKNVSARRYANRTTETRSQEQAFGRVCDEVRRLALRALKEGREEAELD